MKGDVDAAGWRGRNREALEQAGREGYDAFGAGVPVAANPYPDTGGGGGRRTRWALGWRRAEWQRERPAYEAQRAAVHGVSRWGR